jgi:translation initiation factor 4G
MKRRALGNIRFIGELFKKEMLRENIIISCILKLLNAEEVSSCNFNY